jgi:hypothetical protein
MQHWRAQLEFEAGAVVSSMVAPSTATLSVIHNKTFAWAYGGMPYFKYELFKQETNHSYQLLLAADYSVLTSHYSLLATHHSLLTSHHSLLTTHFSLLATRHSLLATRYSLLATRYPLPATRYPLRTALQAGDDQRRHGSHAHARPTQRRLAQEPG